MLIFGHQPVRRMGCWQSLQPRLDGKQEVGQNQEQSLLEARFNGQLKEIFNRRFDGVRPHQFQHQITLSFKTLFHLVVLLNLIFPAL